MNDNSILITHMEDLAAKGKKTGMAHSKFLTAAEAAQVEAAYRTRRDITLRLEGGFPSAERQLAVLLQPEWGSYTLPEVISGLAIQYRRQDTVRHKDVLGAVLGLGLSRDVIGDILVQQGCAYLACLTSIAPYIAQQLDKVGRVGVTVTIVDAACLPDVPPSLTEKQATVASLRVDAVLAAAFNLSRSEVGALIRSGAVQLAHRECLNPSETVRQGDILSLRGKGRVQLVALQDFSRKGRQRLTLGFYG